MHPMENEPNLKDKNFKLHPEPKPAPWKFGKYFILVLITIIIAGIGSSFAMSKTKITQDTEQSGFFGTLTSLVTSKDKTLRGEENDRVNLLLMGIGGKGHDGPELTDTIIYTAYKPSTNSIGMMSIPRDLSVSIPGYGSRKINHANYFGEVEKDGYGPEYAAKIIGETIDQDIQYYIKIDFKGFEAFIDNLGGIDVYIDNSFKDYQYPTNDYKIQTISFTEGWAHMDGETALQFARSRHGTNGEGSDFARSRRQQKILMAVKDNVFSTKTILNPKKISNLLETIKDNISTNLTTWELIRLSTFLKDFDQKNLSHYVLDSTPGGPLYETYINGAYLLLPTNNDWTEVRQIATNIFENDPAFKTIEQPKPIEQLVKIRIENGTSINGLAFKTSQLLEGQGYSIESVANSATRDWEKTTIYDFSEGSYPEELKSLQDYLKADIETSVTGWLFTDNISPSSISLNDNSEKNKTTSTVDFLVILGQNSANLVKR